MAMSTVEADQRLLLSEGQPVSDIRALTFIECPACGTSVAVFRDDVPKLVAERDALQALVNDLASSARTVLSETQ